MKDNYQKIIDTYTPKEDILNNSIIAFITGGLMGIIGEALIEFYTFIMHIPSKEATVCMLITLIFLGCILTCLGFLTNG